jgi:hypothetical protein
MAMHTDDGLEIPRETLEFKVKGDVVSRFLRSGALSHVIVVKISATEVDRIKFIVRTAPKHDDDGFRWPFTGSDAKFVSKTDLEGDFSPVLDGEGEDGDLLSIDDVEEGYNVLIEFTLIPYLGKSTKGEEKGFAHGCTLRLNSIWVLKKGIAHRNLNFESASKRRRLK